MEQDRFARHMRFFRRRGVDCAIFSEWRDHDYAAGPAGALVGMGVRAGAAAAAERGAAGRVARSLHQSPTQQAMDRMFANQMARYGAAGARALTGPLDQAMAVNQ